MTLLLTHGYFLHEDPKEQQIMRPYPPLGILYISAWLERAGRDHEVFDTTFSSKDDFKAYLLKEQPKYIAFYVNLMTKVNVMEMVHFVKNNEALKDTMIITGGPDVRYNAEELLEHGVDAVVIGEGEVTMLALMEALEEDKELSRVNGLAFRQNERMVITPEREKMKEMDHIPFPNRKRIDLYQYLETWKKHHGQSAVSVSTMRGCPYTCKWCSRGVYGLSYRRMSARRVVDELEYIVKEYNPDTLWFVDDVFTVSHKWLLAFRDELKSRKVKVNYECITRADRMNEEVIKVLKETGCFRVWIGAESGSQKIIDKMDRRVDVAKVRDMIIRSQEEGIQAGTFIMLGYPGETEEDIEETIHHLKSSNPDYFTITVAYPIKGTELYAEVEPLMTEKMPWATSTDREIDFKRSYNRKYYDYAVRRVVNEVNYHKKALQGEQISLSALSLKVRYTAAKWGMWLERARG